jgi:hypothetical protein
LRAEETCAGQKRQAGASLRAGFEPGTHACKQNRTQNGMHLHAGQARCCWQTTSSIHETHLITDTKFHMHAQIVMLKYISGSCDVVAGAYDLTPLFAC